MGLGARRRAFQLCALPVILGTSVRYATTKTLGGMLLGTFLVRTGMGVGAPVATLNVAEVSPAFVRGTYGSFIPIATCLGLMGALFIRIPAKEIAGCVHELSSRSHYGKTLPISIHHWWRVCFWASTITASILALAMVLCVESPYWLHKVVEGVSDT